MFHHSIERAEEHKISDSEQPCSALVLGLQLLVVLDVLWKYLLQVFPASLSSSPSALDLHVVGPASALGRTMRRLAPLLLILQLLQLRVDLLAVLLLSIGCGVGDQR